MIAPAAVKPLTLEQVQTLRRLSRDPMFRAGAAELVGKIRIIRDKAQGFVDTRRVELRELEDSLDVANRNLQEAEAIMGEVQA